VSGTCSTHGGAGFLLGGLKGRDSWKDLGVGESLTLRWILGR